MSDQVAGRQRLRWASVIAFAGTPILLAALTMVNLLRASEADELAARQHNHLTQLERRLTQSRGFETAGNTSAIYLTAASSTLAKAEIQQRVAKMIDQVSGRLIEAQAGEEVEPEAAGKVHLRATFDTTNGGLFDLLYAIETYLPLLTVEHIIIRKLPARTDADGEDPLLRVSFNVRGHWRGYSE